MTAVSAGTEPGDARAPAAREISTAVWVALGVVYVLWGSTYLAIRYAIESIPPFTSAAVRFVLAGLVLLAFLGIRDGLARVLKVSRRELASAAGVGVLLLVAGNGGVVHVRAHAALGYVGPARGLGPAVGGAVAGVRRRPPDGADPDWRAAGLRRTRGPDSARKPRATHGSYALGVFFVVFGSVSWSFGSVAGQRLVEAAAEPLRRLRLRDAGRRRGLRGRRGDARRARPTPRPR